MATFEIADKITRANEGGWQNDPHDTGNAANGLGTYRGIASAKQPGWRGWTTVKAILDSMTKQPAYGSNSYFPWVRTLNGILGTNGTLQALVCSFYRTEFWDANRLGDLNSQELANHVYDHGINRGTGTAAMILQRILGVKVDGDIGLVTIKAANGKGGTLPQGYRDAREADYRKLCADHPKNARYLKTWLARC